MPEKIPQNKFRCVFKDKRYISLTEFLSIDFSIDKIISIFSKVHALFNYWKNLAGKEANATNLIQIIKAQPLTKQLVEKLADAFDIKGTTFNRFNHNQMA